MFFQGVVLTVKLLARTFHALSKEHKDREEKITYEELDNDDELATNDEDDDVEEVAGNEEDDVDDGLLYKYSGSTKFSRVESAPWV